jgi:DNA mismatch repair ATPase MutS
VYGSTKPAQVKRFFIDNQTFADLDVFTSSEGSKSIYDLFKHTRTRAARIRLKEMMLHPSNSLQEITERRDIIKYFHDNQVNLDFRNEEVDLIEYYLSSKARPYKNNPIDAAADYLRRNSSNNYYIIKTGLRYLIQLTKYLLLLIEEHEIHAPKYLCYIFEQINTIVNSGVLLEATKLEEKQLSFSNVSRLDRAIRFKEKENIKLLLELVYELDVFENLACVARAKGYAFPAYSMHVEMKLQIKGLYHPMIETPVKNDIILDGHKNIVFLTGSNMAGKSSLLKSLGLIIYLSHLGFPIPADAMETTAFNGLVTTINLPDNINQGLSHYYSEVKRVKDVAEMLLTNNRMFVVFDELFRGTNVKDAFDGSSLIISELSAIKNSAFVISTHIVELADVLQAYDNISFRYLDTYFEEQIPVFSYILKEGISKEALGMYIVRNEGIVEIIQQAASQSKV